MKVIKKAGKHIFAYQLGSDDPVIEGMIAEGKIAPNSDGSYEIRSQESVNGKGETAISGDFIKVDSTGYPYPNSKVYFLNNHRHILGNEYEQIPKPLYAWTVDEPMTEEIEFLIKYKGLVINEESFEKYFTAPLWGTVESTPRNSVIVFYSVSRDENGNICDAEFNFVARTEFDKTYSVIG